MKYIILTCLIFSVSSCISEPKRNDTEDISLVCLRKARTLYFRWTNNSSEKIYIPKKYIGTYNTDDDTIHLEALDKPKYNLNYMYRYDKVFPFSFYTAKKIHGFKPDSTIEIKSQTYLFNQFRVPEFAEINPRTTFVDSIVFDIPPSAHTTKAVFYKTNFIYNPSSDSANLAFVQFLKFDSSNSKFSICPIVDRVY